MLYVTTRDKTDVFTAHHPLSKSRGPCGGCYIPFQDVTFTPAYINGLKEKSFGQCVADILNQFFSAHLTCWDVEFCIGRRPIRISAMSHKILIAECWNNPQWDFGSAVLNLRKRIAGEHAIDGEPSDWLLIAVRIAFLFGIFAELEKVGIVDTNHPLDVSVCAGDFSGPVALWYAREMGLPVGKIIFACNENSGAWDLIHHGELHCNAAIVKTKTPKCDAAFPADMERLIYTAFGKAELDKWLTVAARKGVYTLPDEKVTSLREVLFGAVVSQKRMDSVIRNVYRTSSYVLEPYTALAFGGLQDYRATNTEAVPALIMSEQGPMCHLETVASAMGISAAELKERL